MNKANIAFVVEGEAREPVIIRNMQSFFFKKSQIKILTLPAEQNIYMLWKRLKEDDFETDIIEVLRESSPESEQVLRELTRESFSEIYLFFDYDGHQTNLKEGTDDQKVLTEMLENFNNETENGKLYISYPMVEALRDLAADGCAGHTKCEIKKEEFHNYKNISAANPWMARFDRYEIDHWEKILEVFAMRVSCLFGKENVLSFQEYRDNVDPSSIFDKQMSIQDGQGVFILSAFPEFLIDYQREAFSRSKVKKTHNRRVMCNKRS